MKLEQNQTYVKRTIIAIGIIALVLGQTRLMAGPGYTPVRDVDNGIFNPFATQIAWFSGTSSGFNETASYTVQATNRLEITEISCEAYAPSSTGVLLKITVTCGGTTLTHYMTSFAASTVYPGYSIMSMTSVHLFVDPGSTITVDIVRQSPAATNSAYYSEVLLSGRLTSL